MVKTVAVGVGRVFVGALKVLRFSAWYLPEIAFWTVTAYLSNICALPFSIRLFDHYKKGAKMKHVSFVCASMGSWFAMAIVLIIGILVYGPDAAGPGAGFRSKVNLFLSASSLPIPFTELGIPVRYILYTLLATNLVSFFYEIGRLGKDKSNIEAKPNESEKTEPDGGDLAESFLELMDDLRGIEEMTRELAEKWYKKIEEAFNSGKIDLKEVCHLKETVDKRVQHSIQRSVVDSA